MKLTSILAIFLLFWVLSALFSLPFGVQTPDETGEELVPGQVESAPSNFKPKRVALRATVIASILFGLYYANYVNGWIGVDAIDFVPWERVNKS